MGEHYLCWICKETLHGLMAFASHVAREHNMSAIQYWNKYGHDNDKVKNEKKQVWSVS